MMSPGRKHLCSSIWIEYIRTSRSICFTTHQVIQIIGQNCNWITVSHIFSWEEEAQRRNTRKNLPCPFLSLSHLLFWKKNEPMSTVAKMFGKDCLRPNRSEWMNFGATLKESSTKHLADASRLELVLSQWTFAKDVQNWENNASERFKQSPDNCSEGVFEQSVSHSNYGHFAESVVHVCYLQQKHRKLDTNN